LGNPFRLIKPYDLSLNDHSNHNALSSTCFVLCSVPKDCLTKPLELGLAIDIDTEKFNYRDIKYFASIHMFRASDMAPKEQSTDQT